MFRSLRRKIFRLIVVSGAGAAANYFFDSERGPQRRADARDQANGLLRRGGASASGPAEHAANIFDPPAAPAPATPGVARFPTAPVDVPIVDPAPGLAHPPGPATP